MMFLLACHVFQSVEIPCTAGQRCARPDTDSDTDADTDADTDTDSDPPAPVPSVGIAVTMTRGAAGEVRAIDAAGEQVALWSGLSLAGMAGLTYDPASGTAYVATSTGYARLDDSVTTITPELAGPYVDLDLFGDELLVATSSAIARVVPASGVVTAQSVAPYTHVASLAVVAGANLAWAIDRQPDAPDLIKITDSGFSVSSADYDESDNRSQAIFLGDQGAPMLCSARGIVYDIATLATGSTAPVAVCDADLSDVADCAWDPDTSEYLLFSPTVGVWVMDARGACAERFAVPAGFTLIAGYFYR